LRASETIILPDYTRCGSNLAASIATDFGLIPAHASLPELDLYLKRGYRNVVLLLLDGLGMTTLAETLPRGFLMERRAAELSAVFPSTTTAAATSLRSGKNPCEHGWLGWTMYFHQIGKSVDIFPNNTQFLREQAAAFHAAETFLPYEDLTALISEGGSATGTAISAHDAVYANNMPVLKERIRETCLKPGRHFVYAYLGEPDTMMHKTGIHSRETEIVLQTLDVQTRSLADSLPDNTLLVVTADHGLVDTKPLLMEDHPILDAMLLRPPVLEPRAAALYVKEGDKAGFPDAFHEAYGESFILIQSGEAIKNALFGTGRAIRDLPLYLGDYLAISAGEYALYQKWEHCRLIGMHAGLTAREMRVPLIIARG
jgi:predicted AlkP superfamily pyrophosphatase or phosphodiesterase